LGIKVSGYKVLLRTLEFMALGVGVSALATGILVYSGLVPAVVVEGSVVVAFFLTFVLWGVAVLLTVEYARANQKTESWLRPARLSTGDLRTLISWCPRRILIAALALAAVSFLVALVIGRVSWRFEEALSPRIALGLCSGITLFCSLAVPIIASAARMPGTFQS
jgi:hypothetical protein